MVYIIDNAGLWRGYNHYRPWYKKAIQLLPRSISGRVVELGSGNQELFQLIKNKIPQLVMADINGGKKVIKADFNQSLPFRSRSFSGAISLEVIEHLINHELFLKEIYRILKPRGWLIISTPNIAWWGYRLMMLIGNPPKKEGYHLRFFTAKTMARLLAVADLKVVKTAHFTTIPYLNRLLIWLKLKPVYPVINLWPNLLAQDLVFLCRKQ
jgi:SAM-dependent methyltransferase